MQNAAESFGENDRRTQAWQIQLNNAEAALNDMERELADNNAALDEANAGYGRAEDALDGMDREMDNVTDSADDMGDEIDEAGDAAKDSESKFESLGNVLKTVGAAMGAVLVAAGAAAVKLGKEVISAFADYEQLVGGIDTLFKDSSGKLQEYAEGAYKTAGLSANEYMETVTSFSASLISSLGGDTEKAVEYADMAITDMSDNANKMGSDMSAIQSAYCNEVLRIHSVKIQGQGDDHRQRRIRVHDRIRDDDHQRHDLHRHVLYHGLSDRQRLAVDQDNCETLFCMRLSLTLFYPSPKLLSFKIIKGGDLFWLAYAIFDRRQSSFFLILQTHLFDTTSRCARATRISICSSSKPYSSAASR